VGRIDQNFGDKTRSKLKAIFNSTNKGVFFPQYDAIRFQSQQKVEDIDVQLGFTECRVYNDALLESVSQSKFDYLRQLRTLDMTEDDKERSWERTKVFKFCEEKVLDGNTKYNCLVEWNDKNKSQSCSNFFAISLSDPTPII
jgi:hypothetical protein